MNVLMALDTSPQSAEIVRDAASRPWPAKTQFLLLHVLDPYPYTRMPISLASTKDRVSAQLRSSAGPLIAAGWKVHTRVVLGRPRQDIWKIANSWKADLVLVGTSEEGPLMRVLLGSTARSVLRHASCSVEIVRPATFDKNGGPHGVKVLLATDGSDFSLAAIRAVAKRPWPAGSAFRVIAIPEPFMAVSQFPFELKEVEKLNGDALKDARRYASAAAQILARAGLKVETGTPLPTDTDGNEIIREAKHWDADLIALGSHGRRGFDRLTIGSVSEHVAFHADRTVEVVRLMK